jgi:MFS family permease
MSISFVPSPPLVSTPYPRSIFVDIEAATDVLTLLGGGLFGFDISSMSGVLGTDAYKRYFHNPRSYGQGAITAAMPFGSLVGALSSSFIADKYSRKVSIQIASVIWVIGSMYVSHIVFCWSSS